MGAVFAALAAAAAVWTLKSQRDQIDEQREFIRQQSENLALERVELRAAAQDRKVAQARRVKMSVAEFCGHVFVPELGKLRGAGRLGVEVLNGSDAPIRSVQVYFGDLPAGPRALRVRKEGGFPEWSEVTPVPLIGAGKAYAYVSITMTPQESRENPPVVHFTDDDGVRWSLDYHGSLEEVTDTQAE
ncbi:hypothetical protein GCM10010405_34920 [Streptomyces macrosporus]|uniref:Uncharacterized protein n=1 Tax=Streptomyces macrosporus TaxID=44032 RepID=A0ABN3K4H9_9ACTN